MPKLRLGVIGGGFGKNVVIPAAKQIPELEVAGICTRTPESAQQIAAKFSIPFHCSEWRKMLQQKFDLMYVGVPPLVQEEILEELVERKIPFLCEKPLGVNMERIERTVKAAGPDYPSLINFEFSQIPTWIEAQRLINTGAIGDLTHLALEWKTMQYANKHRLESWKTRPKEGGAAINVFGTHALFSMILFGGEIKELKLALSKKPDDPRDTHSMVNGTVEFATKASGTLLLDCESTERYHQITAKGTAGSIVLRQDTPEMLTGFKLKLSKGDNEFDMTQDFTVPEGVDNRVPGVVEMLKLLLLKMQDHRIPGPNLLDGLTVQRLVASSLR